jgi:pSer/pThr/pTyr-binding forkhead associated (FHA) protein
MSARLMGWLPETGRVNVQLGTMARVGATTENDVVVRVDGVSRTHARIVGERDGFFVEDANSRNGTWLNGERVTRAKLRHLDVITFGRYAELVFVDKETGETVLPVAPPEMRVRIEWIEGPTRGAMLDIPRGEALIGRAESCAIVVDSAAISRAHARLSNTGDRVVIEDLGSANGTAVDGQPIKGPLTLRSGQEISLGQARRFRVWIEGGANVAAGTDTTPQRAQDMEWATRLVYNSADMEAVARAAGGIDKPSAPVMQPVGRDRTPPVAPVASPQIPPAGAARPAAPAPPPARVPAPPPPSPRVPATSAPPAPPSPRREPVAPREPERTQLGGGDFRVPAQIPGDRPAASASARQGPPAGAGAPAPKPSSAAGEGAPATQYGGPGVGPPPAFSSGATEPAGAPRTQIGAPAFKPPKSFEPESAPEGTPRPGPTVLGFREVGPPPRMAGGTGSGIGPPGPPPVFEATKGVPSPSRRPDGPIEALQLSGDLGVYTLPRGVSTVGRSPEATIRIDSREVSRIHAIITVTEQDVIVEDRGSVNGTSINGAAVEGRKALSHGDRVSFADFEFQVDLKRTEGNVSR